MKIGRRYVITTGMLGGVGLVLGRRAFAAQGHDDHEAPTQLMTLFIGFVWQYVVEPYVQSAVSTYFTEQGATLGRQIATGSASSSPTHIWGPGRHQVTVRFEKHPSRIAIHAHMPDGNGGRAFSQDGTAPGHQHPVMREHAHQIVYKAHNCPEGVVLIVTSFSVQGLLAAA
jgi:hypothetical protein